jgi:hypothetical protein
MHRLFVPDPVEKATKFLSDALALPKRNVKWCEKFRSIAAANSAA